MRSSDLSSPDLKRLNQYRSEIEEIDAQIFKLCHQRIRCAQKIMKFKIQKKLPRRDLKREAETQNQLLKALKASTTVLRAHQFIRALLKLNVKYPNKAD